MEKLFLNSIRTLINMCTKREWIFHIWNQISIWKYHAWIIWVTYCGKNYVSKFLFKWFKYRVHSPFHVKFHPNGDTICDNFQYMESCFLKFSSMTDIVLHGYFYQIVNSVRVFVWHASMKFTWVWKLLSKFHSYFTTLINMSGIHERVVWENFLCMNLYSFAYFVHSSLFTIILITVW